MPYHNSLYYEVTIPSTNPSTKTPTKGDYLLVAQVKYFLKNIKIFFKKRPPARIETVPLGFMLVVLIDRVMANSSDSSLSIS